MLTNRQRLAEHIAAYEERAAIGEMDGALSREEAERQAAEATGGRPEWSGSIVRVIESMES